MRSDYLLAIENNLLDRTLVVERPIVGGKRVMFLECDGSPNPSDQRSGGRGQDEGESDQTALNKHLGLAVCGVGSVEGMWAR